MVGEINNQCFTQIINLSVFLNFICYANFMGYKAKVSCCLENWRNIGICDTNLHVNFIYRQLSFIPIVCCIHGPLYLQYIEDIFRSTFYRPFRQRAQFVTKSTRLMVQIYKTDRTIRLLFKFLFLNKIVGRCNPPQRVVIPLSSRSESLVLKISDWPLVWYTLEFWS